MALTTTEGLKTAIGEWMARADLTPRVSDFFAMAESRIDLDLNIRQQQSLVSGTDSDGVIDLPSNLLEIQSLRVSQNGVMREIHPLPPSALEDDVSALVCPIGYVVIGENAYLVGGPGNAAYTLLYRGGLTRLSYGSKFATNWLLKNHPSAYLYGALVEASPYCGEDERVITWGTQYKDIINRLNTNDEQARYGNAPAMRSAGGP